MDKKANLYLLLMIFCALIFLLWRDLGLYPIIFADEWTYKTFSMDILPYKYAWIPSYLYFKVYSLSDRFGQTFLEGARLINNLFFLGAIFFIYDIARKFMRLKHALIVAGLSMFSPINVYTVYFMPESMYFFGFFLLTWLIFKFNNGTTFKFTMIVGTIDFLKN